MSGQACVPCAKRKVRCDRGDPACSNCKRRKRDTCIYPDVSPNDRIKRLEALVRSLGGDPEDQVKITPGQPTPAPAPASAPARQPASSQSPLAQTFIDHRRECENLYSRPNDRSGIQPLLVDDGKGKAYVESNSWASWRGWNGRGFAHLSQATTQLSEVGHPYQTSVSSSVLRSVISSNPSIDLAARHPPANDAKVLWDAFSSNVQPILKLAFEWELEPMRKIAVDPSEPNNFSIPEHAFVFAVYQISVFSLTKDQCTQSFSKDKTSLLSDFQMLFEQALARSNYISTTDVTLIQAVGLYIASGIDRLCTASLFTLMGATLRIAERIGLHRDGTHLDLSPVETERRRRVWWELQHLDLGLAVRCGLTPLTLMANWDTRLPLNINDDDIKPGMTEFPPERKGLTTMSSLLWVLTVINSQRDYFKSGPGLSWAGDKSSPEQFKLGFVERIEEKLNEDFIKYCDPVNPIHNFIQLGSRATVCGLKRLIFHPVSEGAKGTKKNDKHHAQLLEACIRCLEYDVAFFSNSSLRNFHWFLRSFFPWGALICVILETTRPLEQGKAEELWTLLGRVYENNYNLSDLDFEDPRRLHAAELMLTAWKTYTSHFVSRDLPQPNKPAFLSIVEARVAEHYAQMPEEARAAVLADQESQRQPRNAANNRAVAIESSAIDNLWREEAMPLETQVDDLSTLDLDQIDWTFWNTFNGPYPDSSTWPTAYQG